MLADQQNKVENLEITQNPNDNLEKDRRVILNQWGTI